MRRCETHCLASLDLHKVSGRLQKINEKKYEGCFFGKKRFSLEAHLIQNNDVKLPETSFVED